MHRTPSGTLQFSPSDLIAWLEGDFASWCDRLWAEGLSSTADAQKIQPDEADEELDLLARKGTEHEQRYLTDLRARHPDMVELEQGNRDSAATLKAMQAGAPVIYQPFLSLPPFAGFPDFLFRVPGSSHFGDFHYQPWDTKLARSAKPYFLVQLSAYAEMLEEVQGVRPEEMVFVLGHGEERRFTTGDYFYYYLEMKRAFLDFQQSWDRNAMPHPGLDRSWGKWTSAAQAILESSDHLSGVANITRSQIKRLEARGVATMSALAAAPTLRVPRVSETVLERLRLQARLQVESAGLDRPVFLPRPQDPAEPRRGLALLPPPSPLDVFFDLEGFPFAEGGLEYLWGATTVEGGGAAFHDWWAHNHAGEKVAFEHFLDWATERRQRDPAMHIYHYAGYEKTAICRLMGRYATREAQVDDLLRNGVLVDLYTVVRQGLIVGTPSYSLKDIERVFGQERSGDVTTAAGSVVEYQRWLDSGEPGEWRASSILAGIRDYNRVDCESTWLLRDWLLAQQTALGVQYIPAPTKDAGEEPEEAAAAHPVELLARKLRDLVSQGGIADPERARVTELLAYLLEFHRREEKPMWWRMFERQLWSEEQLFDDPDCLAGLRRSDRPPSTIKRSVGLEYTFDPDQDSKLREGGKVMASHDLEWKAEIAEFDGETGRLVLKTTKPDGARELLHLFPYEHVSAEPIKGALSVFVQGWFDGSGPSSALDDFLFRRLPNISGHAGGPLLTEGGDLVPQAVDIARRLAGTTLCIQGPPGTGKTYTAAAIIAELLRDGKRIGVTSNSHKAIINLMNAVVDALGAEAERLPFIKVGDAEGAKTPIRQMEPKAAAEACGNAPGVAGGTAWFFSRPELLGCFDYLFVDEAGQVSLANLVAIGSSAKNLILVGDQMQLAQPSQGSHPGESGLSCLDYLLAGHATIPAELGIFLGLSRRMHPDVCRFISEAVYQGRLSSLPATANQRIVAAGSSQLIPRESGVVFVPVEHEGNAQCSDEEVEIIERIVAELLTRTVVDQAGRSHPLTLARDILLVSPFNMQVRRLKDALGPAARVGSVDKFQGQEAPVVIVSLASSGLEDSPRGAAFLLNKNRLNVAVSRAQALAIVVASPALLAPRCRTIEEMGLVNLLGKLRYHSRAGARAE